MSDELQPLYPGESSPFERTDDQEAFNRDLEPREGSDQHYDAEQAATLADPRQYDPASFDIAELEQAVYDDDEDADWASRALEWAAENGDEEAQEIVEELREESSLAMDEAAEEHSAEEHERGWENVFQMYPQLRDQRGELSEFGQKVSDEVDRIAIAVQAEQGVPGMAKELSEHPQFVSDVIEEVFGQQPIISQQSASGDDVFLALWEKEQANPTKRMWER